MNLGQHANFIVAAYAIAVAVVVLLVAWVIVDHRRQRAMLHDLDASGVTRRSARQPSHPS